MKITLHQEWKTVHIMASALILMTAVFFSSITLPIPHLFDATLYYLAIVPYVLLNTLLFQYVEQAPQELPVFDVISMTFLGCITIIIYTFFIALVTLVVGKQKLPPATYLALYVLLAGVFDKLFGQIF